MTRQRAQTGVTLIELLIAMTLVSLLAVGLLMALRVGLNAMEKSNAHILANRRAMSVQRILSDQISNIIPVPAVCVPPDPSAPANKIAFFQGETQTMRFVSSYSMQEGMRGYARILEFRVIPIEPGPGVRLVVNERLYSGPLSTGSLCLGLAPGPDGLEPLFAPVEIGAGSFVLADKLATCRFDFRDVDQPPAPVLWRTHWIKPFLPSAVRVEMTALEPDPSRLAPLTMTIPVRVNRDPLATYGNY